MAAKTSKPGHHFCGHPTKSGGACSRQVPDDHQLCSQHAGAVADARVYEREERRHRALTLRKAGFTFADIGADMGITRQAAQVLTMAALRDLQVDPAEVAEFRTLARERLTGLLAAAYPLAVGVRGGIPNDAMMGRCLTIIGQMVKLDGLAAPIKLEHSGPGGGPIDVAAMSSEERKVLMVLMAEEATRRSKAIEVPAVERT